MIKNKNTWVKVAISVSLIMVTVLVVIFNLGSTKIKTEALTPQPVGKPAMADLWNGNAEWKKYNTIDEVNRSWQQTPNPALDGMSFAGTRIFVVDNVWYWIGRGTENIPCANVANVKMKMVMRKSIDKGLNWTTPIQVINTSSLDDCIATDGAVYFDSVANRWVMIYQCLGSGTGNSWKGCLAFRSGTDPFGAFVTQPNPIFNGSTGPALCQSSYDCNNTSACFLGLCFGNGQGFKDEGTFDILGKEGNDFIISAHMYVGGGNRNGEGIRVILKSSDWINWRVKDGNQVFPVLDNTIQGAMLEDWQNSPKGFGHGDSVIDGGYYYQVSEAVSKSLVCTDGQHWDTTLQRIPVGGINGGSNWEQYGQNPIFYSSDRVDITSGLTIPRSCGLQYMGLFKDTDNAIYYYQTRNHYPNPLEFYRLEWKTNLLDNGDFKQGQTDNWFFNGTNTTILRDHILSTDGNFVAKVDCTNCTPANNPVVNVKNIATENSSGQLAGRYNHSVNVKNGTGQAGISRLIQADSVGNWLTSSDTAITTTTGYQSLTQGINLLPDTKQILSVVYLNGTGTSYIDQMKVEPDYNYVNSTTKVLMIGNSLTLALRDDAETKLPTLSAAANRPMTLKTKIMPGQSIYGNYVGGGNIAGNPMPAIFTEENYDVVTVQPFSYKQPADYPGGSTITDAQKEREYALKFYDDTKLKHPNAKFGIYCTWMGRELNTSMEWNKPFIDGSNDWIPPISNPTTWNDSLTNMNAFCDTVYDYIKNNRGNVSNLFMIPAGKAIQDWSSKTGVAPQNITGTSFYRDEIHFNEKGSYLVGNTVYSCIFNESPENKTGLGISGLNSIDALAMQKSAGDTCNNYSRKNESIKIGTLNSIIGTIGGYDMTPIKLQNCTILNGTNAQLSPAGASTVIQGTIQNCIFVPNSGSIIPINSVAGINQSSLSIDGVGFVNVSTNFAQSIKKILLIGNSLAYGLRNGPSTIPNGNLANGNFSTLAQNANKPTIFETKVLWGESIYGNYTNSNNVEGDTSPTILTKHNYDLVAVQPFTTVINSNTSSQTEREYALKYYDDTKINSPNAKFGIYCTWPGTAADTYNKINNQFIVGDSGWTPPILNPNNWNDKMTNMGAYCDDIYNYIKNNRPNANNLIIIPGGQAMQDWASKTGTQPTDTNSGLFLDGFHTNPKGSYLVANTLYACAFNESPENKTGIANSGLSQAQALIMQKAAWDTCNNQSRQNEIIQIGIPPIAPIQGQVGTPNLSLIKLKNCTILNGTNAQLSPAGASTVIQGTIQNCIFIPNSGSIIPADSFLGNNTAVLYVTDLGFTNIPTNFNFVGNIGTPSSNPITGNIGSNNMSQIILQGCNIINGTTAQLSPVGASSSINGIMQNCIFVPNSGSVIPADSFTGINQGSLSVDGVGFVTIPTNFSSPQQSSSSSSLSSLQSSNSSSTISSSDSSQSLSSVSSSISSQNSSSSSNVSSLASNVSSQSSILSSQSSSQNYSSTIVNQSSINSTSSQSNISSLASSSSLSSAVPNSSSSTSLAISSQNSSSTLIKSKQLTINGLTIDIILTNQDCQGLNMLESYTTNNISVGINNFIQFKANCNNTSIKTIWGNLDSSKSYRFIKYNPNNGSINKDYPATIKVENINGQNQVVTYHTITDNQSGDYDSNPNQIWDPYTLELIPTTTNETVQNTVQNTIYAPSATTDNKPNQVNNIPAVQVNITNNNTSKNDNKNTNNANTTNVNNSLLNSTITNNNILNSNNVIKDSNLIRTGGTINLGYLVCILIMIAGIILTKKKKRN